MSQNVIGTTEFITTKNLRKRHFRRTGSCSGYSPRRQFFPDPTKYRSGSAPLYFNAAEYIPGNC
jgi:hypothetical protein